MGRGCDREGEIESVRQREGEVRQRERVRQRESVRQREGEVR